MELDEYINLEARVSDRMVLLDISATGEENLIESKEGDENAREMNDLEYRRKQLQQLKEAVVDLEDVIGGISITDLTLNDFRMDLNKYISEHKTKQQSAIPEEGLGGYSRRDLRRAPYGLHAAVTLDKSLVDEGLKPGVIFCLKNIRKGSQAVQVDDNYPLAPYFLVYVSGDAANGPTIELNFTQSKKILDLLKRQAFNHLDIDEGAVNYVNDKTRQGRNMEHYQHLLAVAVDSIAGKSEEKGVESLFTKGGTVLTATSSQGIEDFAVVSWLILVNSDD